MIAKVDRPFTRQIIKRNFFFGVQSCQLKNVFNKQHGSEATSPAVRIPSVRVSTKSIHVRFLECPTHVHDSWCTPPLYSSRIFNWGKSPDLPSGEEGFRKQYKRQHSMRALMDVRERAGTLQTKESAKCFFFFPWIALLFWNIGNCQRKGHFIVITSHFPPPWHFNLRRFIRQE